jgi:hypothetical protein
MEKSESVNQLKRLRNNYRIILKNEDTFEEVIQFKLSRLSVYITLSSIFIILVALTSSLIIFTPLKYYLPGVGYGNAKQIKTIRNLKIRIDSIETALIQQQRYYEDLEKTLKGNVVKLDTTSLKLPKQDNSDD